MSQVSKPASRTRSKAASTDDEAASIQDVLPTSLQQVVDFGREVCALHYLVVLLVSEHNNFTLHKRAFRHAINLQYRWQLPYLRTYSLHLAEFVHSGICLSLCACTTVDSPLCSLMTSGTSLQASLRKIHYLCQPLAKILTTNELIYGFSLVKQSSQEKAPLTERHGNACHYHSPPHPPTY